MKIFAAGREVDIPTDQKGQVELQEVRKRLMVASNRMLIHQTESGDNIELPREGKARVAPYSHLLDIGRARRGSV